ncbi:hypothetical protein CMQ_791 [Grosmannia clavigera kw1407]|uniref:non-specific serine/threonine protein kinase n=1 Tax=Grosmannia clavigera (strain kw1407 / UAMH 11150) TaxID=655863 RepID=F0XF46_GROCL|nr:uncharacterized protein CMQ_791 [Grosmannia clavigera kw1407]EFX03863.1 hypothetical protein CMQ_791 [Grosmannia clavigera kw1407]
MDCRKRLSRAQKAVGSDGNKEINTQEHVKDKDGIGETEKTKGTEVEEAVAVEGDKKDEGDEEDDPEDLEKTIKLISRLRNRLAEFFPVHGPELEPTMLFHDDLSQHNILISEDGALTAVVDWECVSTLPL